jgi:hypothetical protein
MKQRDYRCYPIYFQEATGFRNTFKCQGNIKELSLEKQFSGIKRLAFELLAYRSAYRIKL